MFHIGLFVSKIFLKLVSILVFLFLQVSMDLLCDLCRPSQYLYPFIFALLLFVEDIYVCVFICIS